MTYKGLAPGFGATPSFATPVPWMQPSPYFPPLGAASYEYDNSGFNLEDLDNLDADDRDILGSSQLGGAPPLPSQEPVFPTPEPTVRPSRQAAFPDRLSYPTGHVHAQQRAKRVRRGRGG